MFVFVFVFECECECEHKHYEASERLQTDHLVRGGTEGLRCFHRLLCSASHARSTPPHRQGRCATTDCPPMQEMQR